MADKRSLVVLFLVLMAATGLLGGCGGDDDTGAPATTAAATATDAGGGPSAAEVNAYVEQVRELVSSGDQLNADYDDLTARFNKQEATADEVISQARQNAIAYYDMVDQLESIAVPADLGEANDDIISGFDKWARMYELDAEAVRNQDSALLDEARALDNEAVSQVNDAIAEINRMKDL